MIRCIVSNNLPFSIVEDNDWQLMLLKAGCTTIPLRSSSVCATRIASKFQVEKEQLIKVLNNTQSVGISLDVWTSPNRVAFLGIIAHFISIEFTYQEIVIEFGKLTGAHSGENMAKHVADVLIEYGCESKLVAVTGDNAANIESLASQLSDLLPHSKFKESYYVGCLNHILSLTCNTFFKHLNFGTIVETQEYLDKNERKMKSEHTVLSAPAKIRSLAVYVKRSPQRMDEWRECCMRCRLSERFIRYDVATRWNSTFRMLKDAVELKVVVNYFVKRSGIDCLMMTDDDWQLLDHVICVLEVFDAFTIMLSQSKPLLSLSLPIYYAMTDVLLDMSERKNEYDSLPTNVAAVKQAAKHWSVYYRKADANDIYFITAALDPRYKARWLVDHLEQDDARDILIYVRNKLKEMYLVPIIPQVKNEPEVMAMTNNAASVLLKRFFPAKQEPDTDIDRYFNQPVIQNYENFDLLGWWKANEQEYPLMAQAARDFLCVASTSTSCERIFSMGKDLIGVRRYSLKPGTMRSLMLLKSIFNDLSDE